jgi:transposase InsO family protein
VPVIDCCTREVLGHAVERTGRAKTAERALEEALLARFGTLRSAPPGMRLRHDNGLVFGSVTSGKLRTFEGRDAKGWRSKNDEPNTREPKSGERSMLSACNAAQRHQHQ